MEFSEWSFEDELHLDKVMNTFVLTGQYLGHPLRFCFFITGLAGFYGVAPDPEVVRRRVLGELETLQRVAVRAFDLVYGKRRGHSFFITRIMMERLLEQNHCRGDTGRSIQSDHSSGHARQPINVLKR